MKISKGFIQQFVDAGVLPKNCRRFVIDASVDDVVRVYFDCIGDDALLELVTPESTAGLPVVRARDMETKSGHVPKEAKAAPDKPAGTLLKIDNEVSPEEYTMIRK